MSFNETVAVEIEALVFTYGCSLQILSKNPLKLSVNVEPFTGEDDTRMYVRADLLLSADERYPDCVPSVELQNVQGRYSPILRAENDNGISRLEGVLLVLLFAGGVKHVLMGAGLGDARKAKMLERLHEEAHSSVGNMMVGLLIETARDTLTAMNIPEGDCIFCMCPLSETSGTIDSLELMKLPCYHCFHLCVPAPLKRWPCLPLITFVLSSILSKHDMNINHLKLLGCVLCSDCFARWWRWKQRSLHTGRKQIIKELGAAAGPKLHESGLVPDAHGLYTILCPSCRHATFLPCHLPCHTAPKSLKNVLHQPIGVLVDISIQVLDAKMARQCAGYQ